MLGSFDALLARVGERTREALFQEALSSPRRPLFWSPWRWLLFLVSFLILALGALVLVAGVALVVLGWPQKAAVFWGCVLVLCFWFLRPPRELIPSDAISRRELVERAPALLMLCDRLSAASGAPKVDFIVFSHLFCVEARRETWRRQVVLYVGVPVLLHARGPESVALLGRALVQLRCGDPWHSFWVQRAFGTLMQWFSYLYREQLWPEEWMGIVNLLSVLVANAVAVGLAWIVYGVAWLMVALAWREGQRSVFRGDLASAALSGPEALCSSLRVLCRRTLFALACQRAALLGTSPLAGFEAEIAAMSKETLFQEEEREIRVNPRLALALPPTLHRLAVLNAHGGHVAPSVTLSAEDEQAVRAELLTHVPALDALLLDARRSALYSSAA